METSFSPMRKLYARGNMGVEARSSGAAAIVCPDRRLSIVRPPLAEVYSP
jgi:hypothetical protein